MLTKFKYLLSPIEAYEEPNWGVAVKLIDYEHRDYIEDVFAEHFNLETPYSSNESITKNYVIYFAKSVTINEVNSAVKVINEFHAINQELYETV